MPTIKYAEDLDDLDLERHPARNLKKIGSHEQAFVRQQDDSRSNFNFTYKAARFEAGWLLDSLGGFYEHQWISDVLRRVKGGKEASVYLCRAGAEISTDLIAAKVYRPRMLRNLKNDHAYREGRDNLDDEGKIVLEDRMQRAMAKRTDYGKTLLHQSWIAYEFTSMQALHAAGADIPKPYEMAHNAILMDYIGDLDGCAPTLNEISLERAEARQLFNRVLFNLEVLLSNERIHGDLSAYNILYWEGALTLIDFPQVVSPKINRNAFAIFQRDVTRVCEYFNKQGLELNPRKLATDLWKKHGYRPAPEIHPGLLDAEDERDRALWQKQKNTR